MFGFILDIASQFSMLLLLVCMFILTNLLLRAVRARKQREAEELREANRLRNEARRERRKIGERPAIPTRAARPVASLATVPMRSGPKKPVFGRRAAL